MGILLNLLLAFVAGLLAAYILEHLGVDRMIAVLVGVIIGVLIYTAHLV